MNSYHPPGSMLVLTRKPGQSVYLDTPAGRIEVKLFKCENGKAKLGFGAPKSIPVTRAEVKP